MQYYSTNHQASRVGFKDAMFRSEAADGGLYLPEKLPVLPKAVINNLSLMSLKEIAFIINNTLFGDELPAQTLKQIGDTVAAYTMPLYEIEKGVYVLELFHGPTKTFKDFGAMMFTEFVRELNHDDQTPLNVLVATTGNSGNAIAKTFEGMNNVNVILLYPKNVNKSHITSINEEADNIITLEVNGSIDDCVRMIHKAFEDKDLNDDMVLTAANSLNLGVLLPSTIPYFHAYSQLLNRNDHPGDIYVSVPCGNCGNLLAGYMSMMMGLPISHFIAACNSNAGIHKYLATGKYERRGKSIPTLAYGMDMPLSANVPRFDALSGGSLDKLRKNISSEVCDDFEIENTINEVYERTGYLLDPHAAVAYRALKRNLPKGASGIIMATAHPMLSAEKLDKINFGGLKLPYKIKQKNYCVRPTLSIPPTYGALKKVLNFLMSQDYQQQKFA